MKELLYHIISDIRDKRLIVTGRIDSTLVDIHPEYEARFKERLIAELLHEQVLKRHYKHIEQIPQENFHASDIAKHFKLEIYTFTTEELVEFVEHILKHYTPMGIRGL